MNGAGGAATELEMNAKKSSASAAEISVKQTRQDLKFESYQVLPGRFVAFLFPSQINCT
jgi:hypothetical protein